MRHPCAEEPEGYGGGLWTLNIWRPLRKIRYLLRDYLAEFCGTFIIVFGGAGVDIINSAYFKGGDWVLVTVGWGLSVMMGVYTAGGVSGAHLNPAVTLGMALFNGFQWNKVPGYWLAQVLGGYVAAALTIGLNLPVLKAMNGLDKLIADPEQILNQGHDTSGNFITWPKPGIGTGRAFATEMCLTAWLLFGIFAIVNNRNPAGNPQGLCGLIVGLHVLLIGASWGCNTGYAINPARDFGPRLALVSAGYNKEVFTACNHYFWVPIAGPLLGSALGGLLYFSLIDHTDQIECVPESADKLEAISSSSRSMT